MPQGKVKFKLYIGDQAAPVTDAQIILLDNQSNKPMIVGPLKLDENGETEEITLDTIDKELSLEPMSLVVPYKTYDAIITSDKYENIMIKNIQVFSDTTSLQEVQMRPKLRGNNNFNIVDIPPNGLVLNSVEQKTVENEPTINKGAKVLTRPIIPENITVHLGAPTANAQNVTVPFIDYIKNVASSEIYPTWPETSIRANILAQISFVLNRIYTEWYRSRGYNFDVTNSTAYDQYYVHGRNIFDNISDIVDGIFNNYIARQSFLEPLLAQYCNGTTVTCEGLSQWGTVDDAKAGLLPYQILQKYYGNNIELRKADVVDSNVGSYPGTLLRVGSVGDDVATIQRQLVRITQNYPGIPKISQSEIASKAFGSTTEAAVKKFQEVFNLTPDGLVGRNTWYKISQIYVGVKNLAELDSEGEDLNIPTTTPSIVLRLGDTGENVKILQFFLSIAGVLYDSIPPMQITGTFDQNTKDAVVEFQKNFGLTQDGIVGKNTWTKLYEIYNYLKDYIFPEESVPEYPGYLLKAGARGDAVKAIQNCINVISEDYPTIYPVETDGIFGNKTKTSIMNFQRYFGLGADGIVGPVTWNKIFEVCSEIVN